MTDDTDHDRAARAADYYQLDEQLTDDERAIRDRVRAFGENEVLPVINDYWERAEFPFELVPKLAELGVAGTTIDGYGCPGMSRLAAGIVSRELARTDGSLNTFFGVHSGLAMGTINLLGSDEQTVPMAAPDGPARADRGLRAHRARARLGLGLAGDRGAARR